MTLYDQGSIRSRSARRPQISSRTRTFALLAAVAALAGLLLAACGGGGEDDPQAVVESASFKGIESGKLEVRASIVSTGDGGGNLDLRLSGPFKLGENGSLPQFGLEASASGAADGKPVDFEGALTVLAFRAFVGYEGTEYEIDPTTFGFLKSGFEQDQQKEGNSAADVSACQEAATGLELGEFVENLKSEGSVDVDGTSTTKVSGNLDTTGAVDAVIQLAEDPACSAQLEAAGQLPLGELAKAKGELSGAVKRAHVDVYVGDDEIIRKIAAELTIEPDPAEGKVELDFELTLSEVNEEQEIEAPAQAEPLSGLFQELGVNPIELAQGGLGGLIESLGSGGLGSLGELGGIGGGSSSGGSGGGGDQQEYVECLQNAQTSTDLQKCASLVK